MTKKSRLDHKRDAIIEMHASGATLETIMETQRCSYRSVLKCLREAGVERDQRFMDDGQIEEALRLRRYEGLRAGEIADQLGVSKLAVQRLLKKHDLNEHRLRKIKIKGDVAYVPLTKGKVAKIDAADADKVAGRNWSLTGCGRYATGWVDGRVVTMHRHIMDYPEDLCVDHLNHDGLDNRRANLRNVTHSENSYNARLWRKTGLPRGIWKTRNGKYEGRVVIPTGRFDTPHEAAEALLQLREKIIGAGLIITDKRLDGG